MATKIWMALLVGLVCRWHGAVASAIELVGPKSLWITSPSDVPLLQWLQSVQVDTIEWSGVPLSAVADRSGGGTVSTETDTSPHTVLVTSFLLPRALSPAYLSLSGISQCDIFVFNASVLTTLPPALLLDVDPSDAALLQPALVRLHSGLNFLAIIFWKDSIAGKDLLSVSLTVPDDGARDLVAAGTQGGVSGGEEVSGAVSVGAAVACVGLITFGGLMCCRRTRRRPTYGHPVNGNMPTAMLFVVGDNSLDRPTRQPPPPPEPKEEPPSSGMSLTWTPTELQQLDIPMIDKLVMGANAFNQRKEHNRRAAARRKKRVGGKDKGAEGAEKAGGDAPPATKVKRTGRRGAPPAAPPPPAPPQEGEKKEQNADVEAPAVARKWMPVQLSSDENPSTSHPKGDDEAAVKVPSTPRVMRPPSVTATSNNPTVVVPTTPRGLPLTPRHSSAPMNNNIVVARRVKLPDGTFGPAPTPKSMVLTPRQTSAVIVPRRFVLPRDSPEPTPQQQSEEQKQAKEEEEVAEENPAILPQQESPPPQEPERKLFSFPSFAGLRVDTSLLPVTFDDESPERDVSRSPTTTTNNNSMYDSNDVQPITPSAYTRTPRTVAAIQARSLRLMKQQQQAAQSPKAGEVKQSESMKPITPRGTGLPGRMKTPNGVAYPGRRQPSVEGARPRRQHSGEKTPKAGQQQQGGDGALLPPPPAAASLPPRRHGVKTKPAKLDAAGDGKERKVRVKRKPRGALVSNNNGSQSNDDTALPVAVDTATVPPPAQEQQKSSRADERAGEEEDGEESLRVHPQSSLPQRSPLSSSPDLPGPVCTPLPDIHSRLSQAVVVVAPTPLGMGGGLILGRRNGGGGGSSPGSHRSPSSSSSTRLHNRASPLLPSSFSQQQPQPQSQSVQPQQQTVHFADIAEDSLSDSDGEPAVSVMPHTVGAPMVVKRRLGAASSSNHEPKASPHTRELQHRYMSSAY